MTDDWSDADWVRAFSAVLGNVDMKSDLSRRQNTLNAARLMRDRGDVNILRILERCDWMHPDGYVFNVDVDVRPSTLEMMDPVTPEQRAPGGIADFRPGDILVLDDENAALVIDANDEKVALLSFNAGYTVHPIATVRNLFLHPEANAKLIRDCEIIRQ